ncbi:MAG: UbiD family decarboxylase [Chloroflexota bacterium]
MYRDFRWFLDYLEEKGELRRVKKEVDVRFDIAAGIRKSSDVGGPALLFENIRGFPGWRVAGGVYSSQKRFALALGLPMEADEEAILQRYLECDQAEVRPRMVATGPVKEIIIKGDDVDLTQLPVPTYSELDAGPFLTAGVEFGKHPDTGVQNVAIHRRQVLDRNHTVILARGYQQLGMLITIAEQKGQGLGIATAIGSEPAVVIASQLVAPFGVDEINMAGAFHRAPIEMVKCETIDVEVPAHAEIVIEGVTIPNERVVDGPFGEFPGNYITFLGAPRNEAPVMEITAITMRKNPIFQAVLTGMPLVQMTENHLLRKWVVMAAAYREASKIAEVKRVAITAGGAGMMHAVIAINKRSDDEPRRVLEALFHPLRATRRIVVVDDDINVSDPVEVEWALATRVQPHQDIIIRPPEPPYPAKWGIDATMPMRDRQWYQRIKVPGVEKVDYV